MDRSRKLLLCVAVCAGLLAASTAEAAIKMDIGPSASPVMTGWVGLDKFNDFAHAVGGSYLGPVDLGAGVKAGFANSFDQTVYDRGAAAIASSPLQGLGMNDVLRDFVQFANAGKYLQVKGLTPGTYAVTLYATDPNYPAEAAKGISVNGTNVLIGPATSSPTLSQIIATVEVEVDATGILNIGRGSGSNPSKLNAVEIAAVPEPVSLLLMLTGIGAGLIRRRR